MLVLSRHKDESIIIVASNGERVEVCITEIRGDKVRLGIEAPLSVTINRQEIQIAIDAASNPPTRE